TSAQRMTSAFPPGCTLSTPGEVWVKHFVFLIHGADSRLGPSLPEAYVGNLGPSRAGIARAYRPDTGQTRGAMDNPRFPDIEGAGEALVRIAFGGTERATSRP